MMPLSSFMLLLLLLLCGAPLSHSLTLRRQQQQRRRQRQRRVASAERATLGAAAGAAFNGVLDGMSWPAPPPVNDRSVRAEATADVSAAALAKRREGVRQRMVLAQGTTVTIWGPEALTDAQLADQARTVQHMTQHAACRGMCACFCVMKPADVRPDADGAISASEPKITSDCFCKDKAGALVAKPLENKAVDFYGTPLPKGTPMSEIVRYPVPAAQYNVDDEGLVLSLDAGDKRSYDPKNPSQWTDVSGAEPAAAGGKTKGAAVPPSPLHGEVRGFVGFSEDGGGGALRFGAHGERDVVVVKGLDVSPRSMPTLTVEVWVKLLSTPHSVGRVFGNSIDARARGGRSLFLHNIAYGLHPHDTPPPLAADPAYMLENGRAGASAGHVYQSSLMPPKVNVWAQYVTVWTRDEVVVYRDGAEAARESIFQDTGDVAMQGASHFAIGNDEHAHTGGASKIDAKIALVRLWSRGLEAADVEKLYEHSKSRFDEEDEEKVPVEEEEEETQRRRRRRRR
jgi:hypothetical protein